MRFSIDCAGHCSTRQHALENPHDPARWLQQYGQCAAVPGAQLYKHVAAGSLLQGRYPFLPGPAHICPLQKHSALVSIPSPAISSLNSSNPLSRDVSVSSPLYSRSSYIQSHNLLRSDLLLPSPRTRVTHMQSNSNIGTATLRSMYVL